MSVARVAYVTQWFPPEHVQVPLWIAQALRRHGVQVDVLTGIPNYPAGRAFDGYPAWKRSVEELDGFRVERTPLIPNHSRSALGRLTNYGSWAVSSALLGQKLLSRADVALVYSSPATAALAPLVAKGMWGTPYVTLIQDLWPDSVFATGFLTQPLLQPTAEWMLSHASLQSYRHAAGIGVIAPGMKELLVARGLPADKIRVIYNWADEELYRPSPRDPHLRARLGVGDAFLILYAGTIGPAQSLETAVRAMEMVGSHVAHLAIVGKGVDSERLKELVASKSIDNVHFLSPVPSSSVPGLVAASDVQLVSLADHPLFRITIPSKIQSLLACGAPLLVSAPGDAARVVTDAGAGFVVPPGNPGALASAIESAARLPKDALTGMGDAGRRYYLDNLSEKINAQALLELITDAAQMRRRPPRA